MEWVIGFATGLGASVVTGGVAWTWRRFWNPIRWSLDRHHESYWWLTRVSGPPVFDVELGGVFPIQTPPDWAYYESGQAIDEPRPMRPLRDLKRGDWLELTNAPKWWALVWVERGRRRMSFVEIHDTTMKLEFRRRDVKFGKEQQEYIQQVGWVRRSGE